MHIIGFTGTRNGMSQHQQRVVEELLSTARDRAVDIGTEVFGLHGDCVGADHDFHRLCRLVGLSGVMCRPCTFHRLRAFTNALVVAPEVSPMQRNRAIVEDASLMIACPPNDVPIKSGSGTWATVKYAQKTGRRLIIVLPDGTITKYNMQ